MSQIKPTVHYVGKPRFTNGIALLDLVIGHPGMDNCKDTYTSRVIHQHADGIFETLNTIYAPWSDSAEYLDKLIFRDDWTVDDANSYQRYIWKRQEEAEARDRLCELAPMPASGSQIAETINFTPQG